MPILQYFCTSLEASCDGVVDTCAERLHSPGAILAENAGWTHLFIAGAWGRPLLIYPQQFSAPFYLNQLLSLAQSCVSLGLAEPR